MALRVHSSCRGKTGGPGYTRECRMGAGRRWASALEMYTFKRKLFQGMGIRGVWETGARGGKLCQLSRASLSPLRKMDYEMVAMNLFENVCI